MTFSHAGLALPIFSSDVQPSGQSEDVAADDHDGLVSIMFASADCKAALQQSCLDDAWAEKSDLDGPHWATQASVARAVTYGRIRRDQRCTLSILEGAQSQAPS